MHKDIVLPEVDLSHDDGDPRWHEAGGKFTEPVLDEGNATGRRRWTGLNPGHYAGYWQLCVVENWQEAVAAYEANPQDVHAAYWYLDAHPAFWGFKRWSAGHEDYPDNHVSFLEHESAWLRAMIEISPHKVCPETGKIEDDPARNTKIEWWYEFGPYDLLPRDEHGSSIQSHWHDYLLDGGADTYEEAVLEIAAKVHKFYGNDRQIIDTPEWRNGTHRYEMDEDMLRREAKMKEILGD